MQPLRTKGVIGMLAALSALGVILALELHFIQQTATSTSGTAAERERAAQIDRDDKAAIQSIREHNAQKSSAAPKR